MQTCSLIVSLSSDPSAEGRLGPQPVVLDHTSGFEGLLFVDDDLLGVSRVRLGQNFGTVAKRLT